MMNPWLAIALILAILGSLMVGLRQFQCRIPLHPELARKLVHISMGLITLSFPWLFQTTLPVVVLAMLAVVWLLTLRLYKPLNQQLGDVLGGVDRQSFGEVYFPIAVAILFVLSRGDRFLFCIPMLILTLADAVAAVIGVQYGRLRYTTRDGQKSAEGSVTFFMVAFFSIHVPLLLFNNTGRAETLLIALILGLLVMLLEAIAWRGLDNLFIPLGGFILLKTHLTMSVMDLLVRLAVTVILVIFVLCWRKRTTLNDSAILGTALMGYLSWTLGGWRWLLPPLIFFITYPRLVSWVDQQKTPLTEQEQQIMRWLPSHSEARSRQWERVHDIFSVLSVSAAGIVWLMLFGIADRPAFLFPYTLAFAANLAIVGVAGLSPVNYWHSSRWVQLILYILQGWLFMFLPVFLFAGVSNLSITRLLIALVGTALPAVAYYLTQPYLRKLPDDTPAWICRAVYTTLGSLLGLIPLYELSF